MHKNIFVLLAIITLTLSACNTIEGAGRDIKSAGKSLERSAQDNKPS